MQPFGQKHSGTAVVVRVSTHAHCDKTLGFLRVDGADAVLVLSLLGPYKILVSETGTGTALALVLVLLGGAVCVCAVKRRAALGTDRLTPRAMRMWG